MVRIRPGEPTLFSAIDASRFFALVRKPESRFANGCSLNDLLSARGGEPLLLGGARVTIHLATRAMASPTHDFSIRKSVLCEAARRGFPETVRAAARQAREVT